MLTLAKALVNAAIAHANAAMDSREAGDYHGADLHARNADRVASCAMRAGCSYVVAFAGADRPSAMNLLELAETYGQEANVLGGRV